MRRISAVLTLLFLLLAACGDDDAGGRGGDAAPGGDATADGDTDGDTADIPAVVECESGEPDPQAVVVDVALTEFAVGVEPAEAEPAPAFVFDVVNDGSVPHELNVVRGTIDEVYERNDDGSLPEFGTGRVVAAIDEIAPGERCTLPLALDPGSYSVFCNLVVDGTSHAAEGMLSLFTVTGEEEGQGGPPPHAGGN
jgi:hypothetical protein